MNLRPGTWPRGFIALLVLIALLVKLRTWVGDSPNWGVTILVGVIFGLLIVYVVQALSGKK